MLPLSRVTPTRLCMHLSPYRNSVPLILRVPLVKMVALDPQVLLEPVARLV